MPQAGYPFRMQYDAFVRKYWPLVPHTRPSNKSSVSTAAARPAAVTILQKALPADPPYLLGKSKEAGHGLSLFPAHHILDCQSDSLH